MDADPTRVSVRPVAIHLIVLALSLACGCGKRADPHSQLTDLVRAFPGTTGTNIPPGDPAEIVNAALSAVRQDDYAGGVVALQSVRRTPSVTPEQLRAVQDSIRTLTDDLVNRAARGDLKAKAELEAIEKTRSQ